MDTSTIISLVTVIIMIAGLIGTGFWNASKWTIINQSNKDNIDKAFNEIKELRRDIDDKFDKVFKQSNEHYREDIIIRLMKKFLKEFKKHNNRHVTA